jgi:hypothetical protein
MYQYNLLHRTVPIPSPLIDAKFRSRGFGNKRADDNNNYSFAYIYFPTEYAQEKGFSSEDTLLFDLVNNDFFIIVSDGVSKACFSDVASQAVSQMIHMAWRSIKKEFFTFTDGLHRDELTQVIQFALQAAKCETIYRVNELFNTPPEGYSDNMLSILQKVNAQGGSQSTFSCVFSYKKTVYCIWMGNSAISLKGDIDGEKLSFADPRFEHDEDRFSSTAPDGMRGTLNIEIYPDFLTHNTEWRACIHSDAFEEYENRHETIYKSNLARPKGRPMGINDEALIPCIKTDDTTFIEVYYGTND